MTNFELIRSETIYTGRVFSLRQDEVRLPDNKVARLDIVAHHGAATMVPVDSEGRIWFVRQYRHAAGQTLLELPAGTIEPGESPDACAAREIREEIGMAAGRMQHIGEFFLAPGYSTEYMHIYLATDLSPEPSAHDDDEFLQVIQVPVGEAYAMVREGRIRDAKSLAALMLAKPFVNR